MKRNEVLQIRIETALQARLHQLRDKRHVNVSASLHQVPRRAKDSNRLLG